MLTDRQLDDYLREFAANGWTWSAAFTAVVEQAKAANQYRQAMRIIAAKGNPRDSKIAADVSEVTSDGMKTV